MNEIIPPLKCAVYANGIALFITVVPRVSLGEDTLQEAINNPTAWFLKHGLGFFLLKLPRNLLLSRIRNCVNTRAASNPQTLLNIISGGGVIFDNKLI